MTPTTLHFKTGEITGSHKRNKKKPIFFLGTMITKVSRDLRISLNQSLKPADDQFTGILKNIIKTYEQTICTYFLLYS